MFLLTPPARASIALLAFAVALLLSGCGGGGEHAADEILHAVQTRIQIHNDSNAQLSFLVISGDPGNWNNLDYDGAFFQPGTSSQIYSVPEGVARVKIAYAWRRTTSQGEAETGWLHLTPGDLHHYHVQ